MLPVKPKEHFYQRAWSEGADEDITGHWQQQSIAQAPAL